MVVVLLSVATGGLVGVTVMKMVSFTQIAGRGVPSSQISTTTISGPVYPPVGVYVNVPSALMTIVPFEGPLNGVVFTTKLPSISLSPISVKSPPPEPLITTEMFSLSTTGASFTGLTVINNVSFTHSAGNGVPLSQTS